MTYTVMTAIRKTASTLATATGKVLSSFAKSGHSRAAGGRKTKGTIFYASSFVYSFSFNAAASVLMTYIYTLGTTRANEVSYSKGMGNHISVFETEPSTISLNY